MRKMHWLAHSLRKVKFGWNQVSLWQHRILTETSFKICIGKGKKYSISFLPLLKRGENICHLQPVSTVWRPLASLPVTLSGGTPARPRGSTGLPAGALLAGDPPPFLEVRDSQSGSGPIFWPDLWPDQAPAAWSLNNQLGL